MNWICRDKKIEYGKEPLIMGIVNVTPDSFSDGGKHFEKDDAISFALELVEQGADILDFGAQSTRPGYTEISPEEEIERLTPVLKAVREKTNVPISIDTYFPEVAQAVLELGADIINDVSGVINQKMAEVVKKYNAGWIIMHNGNGGKNEVKEFFIDSAKKCSEFGLSSSQLCFDMGIGFGKTRMQDLELISTISDYKLNEYPILLGTSRKRVIGEFGGETQPQNRIYGNIAADTVAILGGADIIRIHDVKNEKQGIKMANALKESIYG